MEFKINFKIQKTQIDHLEDKWWIDKKHQKKIKKFVY